MTALGLVAAVVCLGAFAGVVNVLIWLVMYRRRPNRPWNWRAVVSSTAYHAWITDLETDAESAERCAKVEDLLADVNTRAARVAEKAASADDLARKREAIERIICASFSAGYDIAKGNDRLTVVPIIDWDGDKPEITGYRRRY